ncbi:hypothetical protein PtA15_12A507 [Puccinia triticina]|uniref:Hydrophobin n=1 Tax=Puccinia triticina TaxID=208348 RepID=A0ABY7D1E1_9BASI|nr:uncharacterized protein PtA15_12A507 [Puccinia triticina]WAQ90517.1 hypothetical protein PtA15_12A507 [Puccinia triticina]
MCLNLEADNCPELLGGVVDALCNPINGKGLIACKARRQASLKAPVSCPVKPSTSL